jgi:hypothetical protein
MLVDSINFYTFVVLNIIIMHFEISINIITLR